MNRLELIDSIKKSVRTERELEGANFVYFTILNDGRTNFIKIAAQLLSNNIDYIIMCAFRVYNHRHGTSNYTDTITILDRKNNTSDEIKLSRLTISNLIFKMDNTCDVRNLLSATIYSNEDINTSFALDLRDSNILFDDFWKLFAELDRNFTYSESEFFYNFFKTKLVENRSLTIQEYRELNQKLIS